MHAHLDEILKAAGEPTRLRILNLLQRGALCVSDLTVVLELPQSSISRHLTTLRHAGLVAATRRGTRALYSRAPEHNAPLETLWTTLARDCCREENLKADLIRLEQVIRKRKGSCTQDQ